jgi:hypothetical protein
MLQVLYGAGTIFILLALQATASARIAHAGLQSAIAQAERCIGYLREMGQTWAAACRTADTLEAALREKAYPIVMRRLGQKGARLGTMNFELEVGPSGSGSSRSSSSGGEYHAPAQANAPTSLGPEPASAPDGDTTTSLGFHLGLDWPHSQPHEYYPLQHQLPHTHSFMDPVVYATPDAGVDIVGFMSNFDLGAPEAWFRYDHFNVDNT